jgi:hypothetical protein
MCLQKYNTTNNFLDEVEFQRFRTVCPPYEASFCKTKLAINERHQLDKPEVCVSPVAQLAYGKIVCKDSPPLALLKP